MLPRLPHERMPLPRSRDAGPQMVPIAEVATETASQMLGSPVSAVSDSSPRERDFIVTGRGFAVRRDEGESIGRPDPNRHSRPLRGANKRRATIFAPWRKSRFVLIVWRFVAQPRRSGEC